MALPLAADKALIFRIAHVDNLPWVLQNGLCCRSSGRFDPNYRNIGNVDLIDKRTRKAVPLHPGGTLSDYVPFYFTSRSPMLLNIKTGYSVASVPMRDIMIMVTSLPRLHAAGIPFVFTDRHAYLINAEFYNTLADLNHIDWDLLSRSDFKTDPDDPGKKERYQAEALIYQNLDFKHIMGLIVHDAAQQQRLEPLVREAGFNSQVVVDQRYFV